MLCAPYKNIFCTEKAQYLNQYYARKIQPIIIPACDLCLLSYHCRIIVSQKMNFYKEAEAYKT